MLSQQSDAAFIEPFKAAITKPGIRRASIRKPPGIDIVFGENDDHWPAADFAIVVHLGRHFIRVWHCHFEDFKTRGTSDFCEFHDGKLPAISLQSSPGLKQAARQ